ncbi:hypothetical protein IV203_033271 [Nitzschia inconspicua]|uniref:ANTAR domain-containing protein n=1 Tax=Nitzschia inconspicua TaxID=303405 RepID=A0A9K3KL78_9STRA|nr:hypothetical protein IV203_033271 [Nitzschia inconspicua]
MTLDRRQLFQSVAKVALSSATALTTTTTVSPLPAHAGGLLQFPVTKAVPLKNKYHLIRAGTSELEQDGIYSTNPLFLTNRENQMHPKGNTLIKRALEKLPSNQLPTVIYHSLAANGMDTGDLIARELKLGRDRLLPEFTYLDQRGIGLWDSSDMSIVKPALWALDELEAGPEGFGARPPANEDGTPNETLHDQFIRLRQFISLQESRTSGETILIIFPDGTGPALFSAMIAGIPFNKVHVLEMVPGELRLDITPESIKELYEQRKNDPDYLAVIEDGKEKLVTLRQRQKDGTLQEWISLKDSRAEEERQDLERQLQERKQAEEARAVERKRQEQAKAQAMAEAKRKADEERRKQNEIKKQKELDRQAERVAAFSSSTGDVSRKESIVPDQSSISLGVLAGTVSLGLLGLGVFSMGASNNDTATPKSKQSKTETIGAIDNITDSVFVPPHAESLPSDLNSSEFPRGSFEDGDALMNDVLQNLMEERNSVGENPDNIVNQVTSRAVSNVSTNSTNGIVDFGIKMEKAEQQLKDALVEAAKVQEQKRQPSLYGKDVSLPTSTNTGLLDEDDTFFRPNYSDDGANDWLKVLVQIRDEDDSEDGGENVDNFFFPSYLVEEEDMASVVKSQDRKGANDSFRNSTISATRDI